jgi:hypothetical protein
VGRRRERIQKREKSQFWLKSNLIEKGRKRTGNKAPQLAHLPQHCQKLERTMLLHASQISIQRCRPNLPQAWFPPVVPLLLLRCRRNPLHEPFETARLEVRCKRGHLRLEHLERGINRQPTENDFGTDTSEETGVEVEEQGVAETGARVFDGKGGADVKARDVGHDIANEYAEDGGRRSWRKVRLLGRRRGRSGGLRTATIAERVGGGRGQLADQGEVLDYGAG